MSTVSAAALVTVGLLALPAFGQFGDAMQSAIGGTASSLPIVSRGVSDSRFSEPGMLDPGDAGFRTVPVGGSLQASTTSTLARALSLVDLLPTESMVTKAGKVQATERVISRVLTELIASTEQNEGFRIMLQKRRRNPGSDKPYVPGYEPAWNAEGRSARQLIEEADEPWEAYERAHFERVEPTLADSLTIDQAAAIASYTIERNERVVREALTSLLASPAGPQNATQALDELFSAVDGGFDTKITLAKIIERAKPNRYGVRGGDAFGAAFRQWDEQTAKATAELTKAGHSLDEARRLELDLPQAWVADWAKPHLALAHETLEQRLQWMNDPEFLGQTIMGGTPLDLTEDAFDAVAVLLAKDKFSKLNYADAIDSLDLLTTQFARDDTIYSWSRVSNTTRQTMLEGVEVAPIVTDSVGRYSPATLGETIGTKVQPMELRLRPREVQSEGAWLRHDVEHAAEEIAPADNRVRAVADYVFQASKTVEDEAFGRVVRALMGDMYRERKALLGRNLDETTPDLFQEQLDEKVLQVQQQLSAAERSRTSSPQRFDILDQRLEYTLQSRLWIRDQIGNYLAGNHPDVLAAAEGVAR